MAKIDEKATIKGLAIWWVILIVVVVIVTGVVILSFLLPRKSAPGVYIPTSEFTGPDVKTTEPAVKFDEITLLKTRQKPGYEPDTITICTGTILEVNDNIVKIKAEKDRNTFLEDKNLSFLVPAETRILSAMEYDSPTSGRKERKSYSIADLKAGGSVVVQSTKNLRDSDSQPFEAKLIYYMEE